MRLQVRRTSKKGRQMVKFRVLCCAAVCGGASAIASAQTRLERNFDDWLVSCQEAQPRNVCVLSQTLRQAKTSQVVLSWRVARTGEGGDVVTILTPTGVSVRDGVTISVAGTDGLVATYNVCGPRACTADFPLDESWREALRRETEFTIAFKPASGDPLTFKSSLKGFAAAYDYYAEQSARDALAD